MSQARPHHPLIVVLITGFLAACGAPSVTTTMLLPAKQPSMAEAKRIGVSPLKGDGGGLYTARLQSFIANIQVQDAPYFTLVDIDREAVLREQRFSDSALADAKTAIDLGRLVAADTLLSGAVRTPQYNKTRSVQEREECVEGTKSTYGDTYVTCEKYKKYVVPCATQTMRFTMSLRATKVSTGTVGFIKDYDGTASHSYCADTGVARDKTALGDAAVEQVFGQIRQDVAPYPVSFTIAFLDYDAKNGIAGKELFFADNGGAKAAFEAGLKLAGQQNTAAACAQFRNAASQFNGSPAIMHNLGVCAEIDGNFDKAITFYRQSATLAPSPIAVTADALARATRNRASTAALEAQLR